MSKTQRQAYIQNGGEYIGVQTPVQQYNRGIQLPGKNEKLNILDKVCIWLDRKGIL